MNTRLNGSLHMIRVDILLSVGERCAFHRGLHVLPIGGQMWHQDILDCLQSHMARVNLQNVLNMIDLLCIGRHYTTKATIMITGYFSIANFSQNCNANHHSCRCPDFSAGDGSELNINFSSGLFKRVYHLCMHL